jgi:putative membrane protein
MLLGSAIVWHKFCAFSKKGTMKNLFNFCPVLAFVFLFFSCNNNSPDSVKSAKDSNAAKIDSQKRMEHSGDSLAVILSKPDADFLVNAASGSMTEVQLGQLAQTNAMNKRVKAFGAMMVRDHGEEGMKLKTLASAKKITLPDAVSNSQQKDIENLQKKTGDAFDKAYITMMLSDHKDDIKEFEKKAKKATDPQVLAFVNSSLEILRRHLDSANSLKKLLGINDMPAVSPMPK